MHARAFFLAVARSILQLLSYSLFPFRLVEITRTKRCLATATAKAGARSSGEIVSVWTFRKKVCSFFVQLRFEALVELGTFFSALDRSTLLSEIFEISMPEKFDR